MKRIFPYIIVLLLISCGNKNQFEINGSIDNPEFERCNVYLYFDNNSPLPNDSTVVIDGKFHFSGQIENPSVGIVEVFDQSHKQNYNVFIALESGNINADLSRYEVSGTPLNDTLLQWSKRTEFYTGYDKLVSAQNDIQNAETPEEILALATHFEDLQAELFTKIIDGFHQLYENNTDNAIGYFAVIALCRYGTINADEIEEAKRVLNPVYANDSTLNSYLVQYRFKERNQQ